MNRFLFAAILSVAENSGGIHVLQTTRALFVSSAERCSLSYSHRGRGCLNLPALSSLRCPLQKQGDGHLEFCPRAVQVL